MRAANVAAVLSLACGGAIAEAQQDSPWLRRGGSSQPPRASATNPPREVFAPPRSRVVEAPRHGGHHGRPDGHDHDGHHHHHGGHAHGGGRVYGPAGGYGGWGLPYGYGTSYGYGPAYGYGYEGLGVVGPGYGFNYYRGPVYGGPPIFLPPAYATGGTFGYGTAYPSVGPDPFNNSLLQYHYDNDWTALSAKAADLAVKNAGDPTAGATAVPVPSTREAKIRSLRYQTQGDEAFRGQDFSRASRLYRQAVEAARDSGAAYMRLGYAYIATGRFDSALSVFGRALEIEPAVTLTGPSPDEVYGPDNVLTWSTHLGRVTRWVSEDVRDADRVLLLGILLYYDGDPRGREFLTKAWQLSGGTATAALPLLNPPKVEKVEVKEPAADPAAGPALGAAPATAGDSGEPLPVLLEIPDPPQAEVPSGRPDGQPPLFPLPSGAADEAADPAFPPLPAPAGDDAAAPGG